MLTEELETVEQIEEEREMPSLNHSIICTKLLLQLSQNKDYQPLVELTLDVDKGLTPDISVFPKGKIKPNFFQDITKYPEMPTLAIEVISASQNIQDLLTKAKLLVRQGAKAVWTVEPFTNTVFVTDKIGEKRSHNQEVESEGIKVDFRQIFEMN
jgi:Uma2 family endonuclease